MYQGKFLASTKAKKATAEKQPAPPSAPVTPKEQAAPAKKAAPVKAAKPAKQPKPARSRKSEPKQAPVAVQAAEASKRPNIVVTALSTVLFAVLYLLLIAAAIDSWEYTKEVLQAWFLI